MLASSKSTGALLANERWRWARVAAAEQARETWRDRARMAAMFIRPGDVVCDLGAGAQPLRAFLPGGVGYLPVDCVDTRPGTYIADFDEPNFTLPEAPFNVLTALGVINWLQDSERFLDRLVQLADGKYFIFTYDLWDGKAKSGVTRAHPEFKTLESCTAVFSKYVRELRPTLAHRRRVFFTGVLGYGPSEALSEAPVTKTFLKYLRPQEYLLLKLTNIKVMPRWMA
jgi:hypothetical protein